MSLIRSKSRRSPHRRCRSRSGGAIEIARAPLPWRRGRTRPMSSRASFCTFRAAHTQHPEGLDVARMRVAVADHRDRRCAPTPTSSTSMPERSAHHPSARRASATKLAMAAPVVSTPGVDTSTPKSSFAHPIETCSSRTASGVDTHAPGVWSRVEAGQSPPSDAAVTPPSTKWKTWVRLSGPRRRMGATSSSRAWIAPTPSRQGAGEPGGNPSAQDRELASRRSCRGTRPPHGPRGGRPSGARTDPACPSRRVYGR